MARFFMGINSIAFEHGYRPDNGMFDKTLVEGMETPDRVYLVIDPWIVEFGRAALLLRRKKAARHARLLAETHDGAPLVVQCQPATDKLHTMSELKSGCYQEGSSVRVLKIFRLVRFITTFSLLDVACVLQRIDRPA